MRRERADARAPFVLEEIAAIKRSYERDVTREL
jgi:hypothetical protein